MLIILYYKYYSLVLAVLISNYKKAATVAEYAHYLFNKEITTSNQIYGIKCPRTNIRTTARKPAWPRRVAADLKVGRYIEKRDTTINLTRGDPTTITKGQWPEMVETCRYSKRHQGRSREGRRWISTRRGNACGLIGRIDCLGTIDKAQ